MTKLYERLPSFGLALILACGVQVVWFFALGLLMVQIERFVTVDRSSESVEVLPDGTPFLKSYVYSSREYQYRLLDGTLMPEMDERIGLMSGATLPGPQWKESKWNGLPWRQRILDVSNYNSRKQTEKWYFIHDGKLEGSGWFVGYNLQSRRCLGYIGRNGFRTDEPPEEDRFSVDGRQMHDLRTSIVQQNVYQVVSSEGKHYVNKSYSQTTIRYLMTRDGLYQINPERRTSKLLLKDAGLCSLETACEAFTAKLESPVPMPKQYLVFRGSDKVVLLGDDGKQARSYTLPPELREKDIQWYELGGGKAMILSSRLGYRGLVDGQCTLTWLEDGGKNVRRQEIELEVNDDPRQSFSLVLMAPSPLPYILVNCLDMEDNLFTHWWNIVRRAWIDLAIPGAACVVLAWLCYRRQRAFGLPWTSAWTAFVLLFGVPGYLGYLAHRRWPARLPCPHCGKRSPRDRSACIHCGRDFPAPELTGTEVFLEG